jgi:hypothetical protein
MSRRADVSAHPETQGKTTALTHNQRHAMPYAVLVDGIIPEQRAAHELQVGLHDSLPEVESLGTLRRAELRQGNLVYGAGSTNEWIPS